jgi:DNA-binding transcriptional MerR regulator
MAAKASYTLSEIARRLDAPQHKLIHLCEKGVVVPEIHDAAGRGSSRVFSEDNFLELAVAVRLREMMLPVSVVGLIVHVLRRFGQELRPAVDGSMARSLRGRSSPELRIIVSDGTAIYFTLASPGKKPTLFGGIPLDLNSETSSSVDAVPKARGTHVRAGSHVFGGPEGSQFGRTEVSVTAIARALQLDG